MFKTHIKNFLKFVWKLFPRNLEWYFLWVFHSKFNIGVTGIILNSNDEILINKHVYRKQYPWGLPSGWKKGKESVFDAIKREVKEETGIEIYDVQLHSFKSNYKLRLEFYLTARTDDTVAKKASLEIFDSIFVKIDGLPESILPAHKEYLNVYFKFHKFSF